MKSCKSAKFRGIGLHSFAGHVFQGPEGVRDGYISDSPNDARDFICHLSHEKESQRHGECGKFVRATFPFRAISHDPLFNSPIQVKGCIYIPKLRKACHINNQKPVAVDSATTDP